MKYIFIFVLFLVGCSVTPESKTETAKVTIPTELPTLTIWNNSSTDLLYVRIVISSAYTNYYVRDTNLYWAVDSSYDNYGIGSSHSMTKTLKSGVGKIYFYLPSNLDFTVYSFVTTVTMTNGGSYIFTITGSSIIETL